MEQRQDAAVATAGSATKTIVVGTLLTVLSALIISFFLSESIIKPFKSIFAGLKSFCSLELGELGKTFLDIISRLSTGGRQVSQTSMSLAEGATE